MGVTVEELSKGDGISLTFKSVAPYILLLLLLAVNLSDVSAMAPVPDRILIGSGSSRPEVNSAPESSRPRVNSARVNSAW